MDMDKRNLGRFCIQFNTVDARHLQVIELLESQGRRKAQYISEAILHYANCSETPNIQVKNDIAALKPMIEAVVRQLLKNEKQQSENTDEYETPFLQEDIPGETIELSDLEGSVDPDLLVSMRESISSFRDNDEVGT